MTHDEVVHNRMRLAAASMVAWLERDYGGFDRLVGGRERDVVALLAAIASGALRDVVSHALPRARSWVFPTGAP